MIGFCTTCKGRAQHLKITLPQNLANNPDAKFIVVDYGSQDDLLEYLRTAHGSEIQSGRLVVYSYRTDGPFRMGHAKNLAHRCAILEGCDILCNLDADNYTGPRFDAYVERQFMEEDIFLWGSMIQGVLTRGINGRIAVGAQAYIKAGGYDEKFECWGSDDKDFCERLKMLGYWGAQIHPKHLNAVAHNDKMRFRDYPHARNDASYYLVPDPCRLPMANWGNFGCGMLYRNFCWDEEIVLQPLPTRIFGIGMHKTATTSLHHAFQILGYDSAHWKSARWAKAIWREMNTDGRSPTLERSYALCDLPIPLLYKALDTAYPGSKFILTIRREDSWLETVERHWDINTNPYRAGWDRDPFTNRMHKLTYGREDFDGATMLARYRRHNAEVIAYFRHREEDFLLMDMDSGAAWPELCGFLGQPIPQRPYPRSFAAY